jgi:hypothetical protein
MSTMRVRATITIEFDFYRWSLTDNITPVEIGDVIAARYLDRSVPIVHAAWGEVGKPWTREHGTLSLATRLMDDIAMRARMDERRKAYEECAEIAQTPDGIHGPGDRILLALEAAEKGGAE